jgi:hypothetical protein
MPEEKTIPEMCRDLREHAEQLREMSRRNLEHTAELVRMVEKLTEKKEKKNE